MIRFLILVSFVLITFQKKVLIAVTNHDVLGNTTKQTGWWLSEVAHPYHVFTENNFDVEFLSPLGGVAPLDPLSVDIAEKEKDQISLDFYNNKELLLKVTNYTLFPYDLYSKKEEYSAIFFAGGHGTMWDFPDAEPMQKLGAFIWHFNNGVVSAVCHGPSALLTLFDLDTFKNIIEGRKLTCFSNKEEEKIGLADIMPFSLEDKLKEAGGIYSEAEMFSEHVVVAGRLVTGQNPASAAKVAEEVVKILKK